MLVQLESGAGAAATKAKNTDEKTAILLRTLAEMDSVYRETLRVVLGEKAPESSFFYKIQRAVGKDQGIKLQSISRMGCEQYAISYVPDATNWQQIEIKEKCKKNPEDFVTVRVSTASKDELNYEMTVAVDPLQSLLGLEPSLASRLFQCSVSSSKGHLIGFKCKNLTHKQASSEKVLKIDSLVFKKVGDKSEIQVSGNWLVQLVPSQKISVQIPLEGPIDITETELYPEEPKEPPKPAPLPPKIPDKLKPPKPPSPTPLPFQEEEQVPEESPHAGGDQPAEAGEQPTEQGEDGGDSQEGAGGEGDVQGGVLPTNPEEYPEVRPAKPPGPPANPPGLSR